ncbi:hypothetical protein MVEN_00964800 [Mycena venus]|uniref:Uncharacterized protein n=1 Tax=Mycena venus TaxID=2733690 RepID=A0A8H6Y8K5_9AGAR|nr:hypothetical protein MVEN_00964800 [Mycena venus]
MSSFCRTLFISALLGLSAVNAWCGDNGGAGLAWGSQAEADKIGFNTILGFKSSGPFDTAGNPILTVVSSFDWSLAAFICGQKNPDSYPQTTFGPVLTISGPTLCLTISELEAANATISLQPCVNDITANPVPTQMFQWIGTDYITYGFEFIGNQSVPVDPSSSTDYVPTLVPATNITGAYVRLDYLPDGLPASTGLETGMILNLSDD